MEQTKVRHNEPNETSEQIDDIVNVACEIRDNLSNLEDTNHHLSQISLSLSNISQMIEILIRDSRKQSFVKVGSYNRTTKN